MKIILSIFFSIGILFSQAQSPNQNISNYVFADTEPYIAVNPANPNNIIAAWMKVSGVTQVTIAVSYSTNGGTTWSIPSFLPHLYPQFTHADVSIDFNANGTAYICYIDYTLTQDSGYICVSNSTNGGQTWSPPVKAFSGLETPDKPIDRPWIAVDRSGGQYNGRLYITTKNVEDFITTDHVYIKSSSDGGLTWTPIKILDDSIPCDLVTSMGCLAVGSDGSVNVMYFSYHLQQSLFPRIIFTKSLNGGANFTPYVAALVTGASAINDTLQFGATLSSNPTNANNLIFTVTDNRNGDADIMCIKTNDGGYTWTQNPVRINDDNLSNGVQQDMSWAGFSPNGMYSVVWRDRRNSGTWAVSPFEIYMAASWNGGSTFSTNHRVSSAVSPDIPIQKGNDFIGVALTNTFVYTVWCDKRTNNTEIFVNRDTLQNILSVPSEIEKGKLHINAFPNPTSGEITFSFMLSKPSNAVSITITDFSGKTIAELFSGSLNAGQQIFKYNTKKLAQGTYFVAVTADGKFNQKTFIVE